MASSYPLHCHYHDKTEMEHPPEECIEMLHYGLFSGYIEIPLKCQAHLRTTWPIRLDRSFYGIKAQARHLAQDAPSPINFSQ